MRPVSTHKSELQFPLDVLIGTKAQVRVLRLLSDSDRAMSAPEIQEGSGLTLPGTLKVLDKLSRAGIVSVVGSQRSRRFALQDRSPLSVPLRLFFRAERDHYETLLDDLRSVFDSAARSVDSAWLHVDSFKLGGALEIGFLTGVRSLAETKKELRRILIPVEERLDITIELLGYTRADLPELDEHSILLLAGVLSGLETRSSFSPRSHADLETRSRQRAERVVQMIRRDPSLVSRARRQVEQTLENDPGAHRTDLAEWQHILVHYSQRRLLEFLVDPGQRATRLRQSSPFFAVLTAKERKKLKTLQSRS